jgi:hypothetical protein
VYYLILDLRAVKLEAATSSRIAASTTPIEKKNSERRKLNGVGVCCTFLDRMLICSPKPTIIQLWLTAPNSDVT